MPVQINEMVIRANVVEGGGKNADVKASPSGDAKKDDIVKEVTELVMEIINNKNQR